MRRFPAAALAALSCACGRLDFDAVRGSDGGGGDGGGGPDSSSACTALVAQSDDFASSTRDPKWDVSANAGVTVAQAGGELVVALPGNTSGSHYGGYTSHAAFDVRSCALDVNVLGTPSSSGSVEMLFTLVAPNTDHIGFDLTRGNLAAYYNDGSVSIPTMAPFDPVAQAHLELAYDAPTDQLVLRTSPDGLAWTQFYAGPPMVDLSNVRVRLDAGTFGSVANPGSATYGAFTAH